MENEVQIQSQVMQFYQDWFNTLSKQVHFIEFKSDENLTRLNNVLEEIDYRFTLLEDKLLRLEDRVSEITEIKTKKND